MCCSGGWCLCCSGGVVCVVREGVVCAVGEGGVCVVPEGVFVFPLVFPVSDKYFYTACSFQCLWILVPSEG